MWSGSVGKRVREVAFLIAVFAFYQGEYRLQATLEWCYDICGPSAACETECLVDSDPALESTCGQYDGGAPTWCDPGPYCGDGICDLEDNEDRNNCSEDCGPPLSPEPECGQFGCEQGEDCWTCPQDCGSCEGPDPEDPDDGECPEEEDPWTDDCLYLNESCEGDGNCASIDGRTYMCVDGRCIAEDLPEFTSAHVMCNGPEDCPAGWSCKGFFIASTFWTFCLPDWL